MAGLSTNAPGLWGGFAGLLYGSTSLSTPPGFLADATPAWVLPGAALDLDFADSLGYNSRNLATTTPDSILTYTAPSPKMVYGSDGVLYSSSGVLPIDHDPITFDPLGVLIEEQRTNLLTYSEQFDNAAWTKSATTVSANADTAPDGTATADRLLESATTAAHQLTGGATVATVTYTLSIFAKAGSAGRYLGLRLASGAFFSGEYTIADLSAGTIETSGGGTITPCGNGWYRVTISALAKSAGSPGAAINIAITNSASSIASYAGDGASFISIWGVQLEAGAFATSYIPTVASQVTRAADQVSILTSTLPYNAAAGTVLVEGSMNGNGTGTAGWWALDAGAVQNGHSLRVLLGSNIIAISRGATTNQTVIGLSPAVAGVFYETAFAYSSTNDRAISTEGGAVVSGSTDVGTINSATTLRLGFQQVTTTGGYINGHIKRLTYFPTRRTNADLQVLST